jgi:hypothetical protein
MGHARFSTANSDFDVFRNANAKEILLSSFPAFAKGNRKADVLKEKLNTILAAVGDVEDIRRPGGPKADPTFDLNEAIKNAKPLALGLFSAFEGNEENIRFMQKMEARYGERLTEKKLVIRNRALPIIKKAGEILQRGNGSVNLLEVFKAEEKSL